MIYEWFLNAMWKFMIAQCIHSLWSHNEFSIQKFVFQTNSSSYMEKDIPNTFGVVCMHSVHVFNIKMENTSRIAI